MPRDLTAQWQRTYDTVVIGGGSNGTAVARDAALRGLQVALLEKEDFGYGTVSRSTRLIHGGLRYLELLDFGLVREGLRERGILLRTAPHLVRPLAFFTPVYKHSRVGVHKLRLGMGLYDMLARDRTLPRHSFLNAAQAADAEPLLNRDGLLGAFIYYDGHVPMPERLCLEAALQAADRGAVIANHVRAESLSRDGDVFALTAVDELNGKTYTVRARTVVNATGPWADDVNDRLLGAGEAMLRKTKGIHLLVPKLSRRAVVMLAESDGRLFFAVPWGEFTYIGTTDTDFDGDLDAITADKDEVEYLLQETKRVFPRANLNEVYFTTAGVRPLVRDPRAKTEGQVSRKHRIVHHDDRPGYFSVLGGKITNMRSVAEETVDLVVRHLGVAADRCTTASRMFPGALLRDEPVSIDRFKEDLFARGGPLPRETVAHLVDLYGTAAKDVLDLAEDDETLREPISEDAPDVWAQLVYGVRREWVFTAEDFLLRRTSAGLGPNMARRAAPEVARRLGRLLDRTDDDIALDVSAYERTVERMAGDHILGPMGVKV